jgi:hypothetical protein
VSTAPQDLMQKLLAAGGMTKSGGRLNQVLRAAIQRHCPELLVHDEVRFSVVSTRACLPRCSDLI